jgi:hypothetical protein
MIGARARPMNDRSRMGDRPRMSDGAKRQLATGREAMRRGGGLRRLPDLLGKVLDPASRRRGLAEAGVLTDWPRIVGEALAARCQPVKMTASNRGHGGILHVHVAGSAALELQHSEPQLLERINSYFGYPAVARLRLIRAPLALPRHGPATAAVAAPATLDAAAQAEIEAVVQPVADDALRAALSGLGAALKAQPDPQRTKEGKHG